MCCVFDSVGLVKHFAICLGAVAILFLNGMEVLSVSGGALLNRPCMFFQKSVHCVCDPSVHLDVLFLPYDLFLFVYVQSNILIKEVESWSTGVCSVHVVYLCDFAHYVSYSLVYCVCLPSELYLSIGSVILWVLWSERKRNLCLR